MKLVIASDIHGAADGCVVGDVAGSYVHGLLDDEQVLHALCAALRARRGLPPPPPAPRETGDAIAPVAAALRRSLDLPRIYRIIEEGVT